MSSRNIVYFMRQMILFEPVKTVNLHIQTLKVAQQHPALSTNHTKNTASRVNMASLMETVCV